MTISQTGDHSFEIDIPKFIFIGHDNETFELAAENNGILSWTTPEIDEVAMVDSILSDEAQDQYVQSNQEILQDQARTFYTRIVTSIDPTSTVSFEFSEQ